MTPRPWLVWVTDRSRLRSDLPERAASLARGGVDVIQLRENDLPDGELVPLARAMARAIAGTGARLLVNDRFDLALAVGAGGVHLKSDGLQASEVRKVLREQRGGAAPAFLIGRACHGGDEIAAAARDGETDYVTLSPLHATGGKSPLGHAGFALELRRARDQAAGRPLPRWLALGGVGVEDVGALASLRSPGERWGLAAVGLLQVPDTEARATGLARSLVTALSSLS